jgi:hypothetical protein
VHRFYDRRNCTTQGLRTRTPKLPWKVSPAAAVVFTFSVTEKELEYGWADCGRQTVAEAVVMGL